MKHKTVRLLDAGIFFISVFVFLTSFQKNNKEVFIWRETEDANEIISPVEIFNDSLASKGQAIVSMAPSHVNEGSATYTLDIPIAGNYHTWFRAYWPGACSNSYFFNDNQIFKVSHFKFGDHIRDRWHWLKGPELALEKGFYQFTLVAEEYNARLDNVLFTTDVSYMPSGLGKEIFNFECAFDEPEIPSYIHPLNKNKWKLISVESNSMLQLIPNDQFAIALFEGSNPAEYYISLDFCASTDDGNYNLIILIDWVNMKNMTYVEFFPNKLAILDVHEGQKTLIWEKKLNNKLNTNIWHFIELLKYNQKTEISINHERIFHQKIPGITETGKVGLGSEIGELCIDNLRYFSTLSPQLVIGGIAPYVEQRTDAFDQNADNDLLFKAISGNWRLDRYFAGCCQSYQKFAFSEMGRPFWYNYQLKCALKLPKSGETGIETYYIDPDNFYRMSIINQDNQNFQVQLIKKVNGEETVLDSSPGYFYTENWYKFNLKILNNQLVGLIDDSVYVSASDSSLTRGKVGFYTTSKNSEAGFDDVFIQAITEIDLKRKQTPDSSEITYNFDHLLFDHSDFYDWKILNCDFQITSSDFIDIQKLPNATAILENKYPFHNGRIELSLNRTEANPYRNIHIYFAKSNGKSGYEFVANDSTMKLYRNGNLVKEAPGDYEVKQIAVEKNNGNLKLSLNEKTDFEFEDKNYLLTDKVGIKISGICPRIGFSKISLKRIGSEKFVSIQKLQAIQYY